MLLPAGKTESIEMFSTSEGKSDCRRDVTAARKALHQGCRERLSIHVSEEAIVHSHGDRRRECVARAGSVALKQDHLDPNCEACAK